MARVNRRRAEAAMEQRQSLDPGTAKLDRMTAMHEREQASAGGGDRRRVEAVVETLARLGSRGETLAEITHDVRNMVTALGLYCDLLEEPGVLSVPYRHYGEELRLVAAASRRLVEKLVALDARTAERAALPTLAEESESWLEYGGGIRPSALQPPAAGNLAPGRIENLAAELTANRNLLAALAGPAVALTLETEGGALPVALSGEDLTRILVNLVKNAAEAIDGQGRIRIELSEQGGSLQLVIEDDGPGMGAETLARIFESGFTTRDKVANSHGWPTVHRGLGLAITRSIVEAAGGRVAVANRSPRGARFTLQLPVG